MDDNWQEGSPNNGADLVSTLTKLYLSHMRKEKGMHRIWVVSDPVLWAQIQYLVTVLESVQENKRFWNEWTSISWSFLIPLNLILICFCSLVFQTQHVYTCQMCWFKDWLSSVLMFRVYALWIQFSPLLFYFLYLRDSLIQNSVNFQHYVRYWITLLLFCADLNYCQYFI